MMHLHKNNNVNEVVKKGLCTSCGICIGACFHKAITFEYGKERNIPVINNGLCINCGLCYKVCPGKGIQLNAISNNLFGDEQNIKYNQYVGRYLYAFVGYSCNEELRFHGATGGMVSQFLVYLLEKGIIDGAVVVRYKKNSPFEPEPFIASKKEEIIAGKGSKYVVVSMDKVVEQLLESDYKKVVVVGLPCHIQGFRHLVKLKKNIREKIIGFFSIYCSVNKTKHSIDYYSYRYNINPLSVKEFSFRDDGCMGFMKYTDHDNKTIKKIPYKSYWFGTHSFFVNNRCTLCIDQLGELADISFGDIHIEPYKNDTIGTNSIITRSNYWNSLLLKCYHDDFINLNNIDIESLIDSQTYVKIYKKGAGVRTKFLIRRLLCKINPEYDYRFTDNIKIKYIISELIKASMRVIGRYRFLWFIIKFLDRNKD